LKEATKEDPILQAVFQAIREGWKTKGNTEALEHFKKLSELSIIDDKLLGDRVIPEKLKKTCKRLNMSQM